MRENTYQAYLISLIKHSFPGCYVLKNDSGYLQGIPDLLVLFEDKWAMLEVKPKEPTGPDDFEPNQEWYLEEFNKMSYGACIHPNNEEAVLNDLQLLFEPHRKARVSKRQ